MEKKVNYSEIASIQMSSIDTLFNIYARDKYKARVYYFNSNPGQFIKKRVVVFDEDNGDFNIVIFERKFGISKTNKIYSREKRVANIIKKGNKFYYKSNGKLSVLLMSDLSKYYEFREEITKAFIDRVPYCRYLTEINFSTNNISITTVHNKKLFSMEKYLKHFFDVPYSVAKLLYEDLAKNSNNNYNILSFKKYKDYLINVESLVKTYATYNRNIFYDSLRMAKVLGVKINCSWSSKRLKQEHDNYSKLITEITLTEDNRVLNINKLFVEFSEFSGFELLRTTKELAIEGKKQSHCVATYANVVDSGNSAIFHINGFTLELTSRYTQDYSSKILIIKQFRGYRNSDAPKELYELVLDKLNEFNGGEYQSNLKSTVFEIEDLF